MSDRIEDVTGFDTTRHDFRQQRLEEEIVLATDQDDLGGIIPSEQAAKPARRFNAREPATHDDNSDRCCLSTGCGHHRILLTNRSYRCIRDISSKYSHKVAFRKLFKKVSFSPAQPQRAETR